MEFPIDLGRFEALRRTRNTVVNNLGKGRLPHRGDVKSFTTLKRALPEPFFLFVVIAFFKRVGIHWGPSSLLVTPLPISRFFADYGKNGLAYGSVDLPLYVSHEPPPFPRFGVQWVFR